MEHGEAGAQLVGCMRAAEEKGLSRGSSGNASLRCGDGMLITPSGVEPRLMRPEDMLLLDLCGKIVSGISKPSTEWPLHAAIYRTRPDAQAVFHCHSRHATALACCGLEIPPFHYMVAMAGGDSIRCAPYALFGSGELVRHALEALESRRACLLANHGQITLGATPERALALAIEVEELAAQYISALAAGEPRLLDAAQMQAVMERFVDYGPGSVYQPRQPDSSSCCDGRIV